VGLLCAIVTAVALTLIPLGNSAEAEIDDDGIPTVEPAVGSTTHIRITSLGAGLTLPGFQPRVPTTQDPTAPYPVRNPPGPAYTGSSNFAGTIITSSIDEPGLTAEMYCINLRVPTEVGIGYESGTWSESAVPNIPYVTYILNNYYPTTDEPATLSVNERAAAVQAAIWYFTDGYLVNTSSPVIRAATAAIVTAAQAAGPGVEPPAPTVTITPESSTAPATGTAGPYTVTATGDAAVTVSVPAGYALYGDAAGTVPLGTESSVESGSQVWIRPTSATAGDTTLLARAVVTAPRGQVYLYDQSTPGLTDAQRLILADTAELEETAEAAASFYAVGEITVNKSYLGDAAGEQGAAQLVVDCGPGYVFTVDIPAGTTDPQSSTFSDIPAGVTCTVTEPVSGETTAVSVTSNAPQTAVVPTSAAASVDITNTVAFRPGALSVTKVVTGTGAGLQEAIVLRILCSDFFEDTFAIEAGAAAGSYSLAFEDLPADIECTVSETADGSTSSVQVTQDGPVTVTIEPGVTAEAVITNTVTPIVPDVPSGGGDGPGELAVTGGSTAIPPELVIGVLALFAVRLMSGGAASLRARRQRRMLAQESAL